MIRTNSEVPMSLSQFHEIIVQVKCQLVQHSTYVDVN